MKYEELEAYWNRPHLRVTYYCGCQEEMTFEGADFWIDGNNLVGRTKNGYAAIPKNGVRSWKASGTDVAVRAMKLLGMHNSLPCVAVTRKDKEKKKRWWHRK